MRVVTPFPGRRRHRARTVPGYAVGIVALLALVACGGGGGGTSSSPAPTTSSTTSSTASAAVTLDEALRDELVAMLARDQAQRTGTGDAGSEETDEDRTARLKEIVAEHGWPGYDLVGEEGEEAAWTIAQHSDLDPEFQSEALELLRAAVEAGQASPGNLAYLEDRVAVAEGRPQTYGTQIGCAAGGPEPSTPIEDPDGVEERRAAAGLGTLDDYLAEMTAICSADG